jgi:mono/diheme cytochrome c family protein
MKRLVLLSAPLSLFVVFIFVGPAWRLAAQPPTRSATARNAPGLDAARRQYRQYCARCHDNDFSGSGWRRLDRKIPDFTDRSWQESRTDAQLLVSILDGKGTRMPGFNGKLDEPQGRDLVRLIRSVQPPRLVTAEMATDFSKRYGELLKELEKLRKEFRELSGVRTKPDGAEQ